MMQDDSFTFTSQLDLRHLADGGHAGITMFDKSAHRLEVIQKDGARTLQFFGPSQQVVAGPRLTAPEIQLRIRVEGETATYFYSIDRGRSFQQLGPSAPIVFSWWKGSRPALFAFDESPQQDSSVHAASPQHAYSGYVDFDWAHYAPLPSTKKDNSADPAARKP